MRQYRFSLMVVALLAVAGMATQAPSQRQLPLSVRQVRQRRQRQAHIYSPRSRCRR
jgi:hypothetical protein